MARLTDTIVRGLPAPASGNRITYDDAIKGFGARITAAGARAFVLNFTLDGRERRMTIGGYPAWTVAAARDEAKRLRQQVDRGIDPLGEREARRQAPTVSELCDRYLAEHAVKKRSARDDQSMIRRLIRPELGNHKVAAVGFADIDRLHRKVTGANGNYIANRALALLSMMFALAIRWGLRADNPCKGVTRNPEEKRYRYLAGDELRRLTEALAAHPNRQVANAVRLLMLTGARRGEVLGACWGQIDLAAGIWTKPASLTKQAREHRLPLSAPARQLLAEMKAEAESPYVFPARSGGGPLTEIDAGWAALRKAADLKGVRLHDLRHSFASILASAGLSLPIIGALLGHSQPGTTARYAHLFDDPLRAATETAAAVIGGADVVPLRSRRAAQEKIN
jgi:integrase